MADLESVWQQSGQMMRECDRLLSQFDVPLNVVVQDTENSAVDIIERTRKLDKTAHELVDYLNKADFDAVDHPG
ncbi:MAG: hypothetical protein ABW095_04395 [Candidatus Thiodiazotropha sp.]